MNVVLAHFAYGLQVRGRKGGLEYLQVRFDPAGGAREDREAATAALRPVMERYTDIFDRLVAEDFLKAGRVPVLDEWPAAGDVGYEWSGSWRRRSPFRRRPDVGKRLSAIFGVGEPDMRGQEERHVTHRASVRFGARKEPETLRHVEVTCSFGHKVNVCLLRFAQSLHDGNIAEAALDEMRNLDRALSLAWDRMDVDWYKALVPGAEDPA